MAKLCTTIGALAISLVSFSQVQTSGKVTYSEKIKMDLKGNLDGLEEMTGMKKKMEEMMKQLEKQKRFKVLYFSPEAALFTNLDPQDDGSSKLTAGDDHMQIKIQYESGESKIFTDLAQKKMIRQEDFMGKRFLINGKMEGTAWKLEKETKEVLGYLCNKAVLISEEDTTIAWYTTKIPVPFGPMGVGELPGLVLEAAFNGGELTLTAEEIDFTTPQPDVFKAPSSGKKMTQEKFDKLRKQKEAEMEEFQGKGGGKRRG
ncbi:MAG: GLPGLI family protein [Luteibaculaceae bacterium]|jgi:GLPGLI family protein